MKSWKQAVRGALVSGTIASVASTTALLACGRMEAGRMLAPINAISHWYWGSRAARHDRFSFRHTILGYITHHGASIFWATFYEKWFETRKSGRLGARQLGEAAAISGLACFVDYKMTPERLTPGYELRLSRAALFVVYAAFALGLAIGGNLEATRTSD